jgi:hypothetical protein
VPIGVVSRQTRTVQADYQSGMAQPDLGDEALETLPFVAGAARFAEILIDDDDALSRPAELDCPLDEVVLQVGAFGVVRHLVD